MPRFRLMLSVKWTGLLVLLLLPFFGHAQVVGGERTMEFLRLPNAPHISALGGINVANPEQDIAFAGQNPALMRPGLHNQLSLNYNGYYSGISIANLMYGYHVEKIKTSFALGVQYINYGSFVQTDYIGNELGSFRANEYAITLGASRQYKEHWRYGANIKYAYSGLYDKYASALLTDIGISYYDTGSLWNFGAVAKNIGFTLKKYNPSNSAEPLPFDLQIGVSKRFKHLPLRLMVTAHHLYQWDVRYDNPADAENNSLIGSDTSKKSKSYFGDKLFRHLIFGAEVSLGKRILISVAYNHLHRGELVIKDKTGMAGFSFGAGINLNKFQVHYARTYYHIAGAYNEFGLTMSLNKLFGIGKTGEKINWNASYPDWQ